MRTNAVLGSNPGGAAGRKQLQQLLMRLLLLSLLPLLQGLAAAAGGCWVRAGHAGGIPGSAAGLTAPAQAVMSSTELTNPP